MFEYMNLDFIDGTINGNNFHRKKSIYKALDILEGNKIISIEKISDKKVILNGVWNPFDKACT